MSYSFRTLLASSLLLIVTACQRKPELALDRPYVDLLADANLFAHDMADIQREHSLPIQRWQHLRLYSALASSNSALYPIKGISYRQASELLEKYQFSSASLEKQRREQSEQELPPLDH